MSYSNRKSPDLFFPKSPKVILPVPDQISPTFVQHILCARTQISSGITPSVGTTEDRCVDSADSDSGYFGGHKTCNNIIAGSSGRRVLNADGIVFDPYLHMQEAVQQTEGPVKIVIGTHQHCGEFFSSSGFVTPNQQAKVREYVEGVFRQTLELMRKLSPADAKRLTLETRTGPRGSAPTIELQPGDRFKIANHDYFEKVMSKYPLDLAFVDRLVTEQRDLVASQMGLQLPPIRFEIGT